LPLPLLPDVMVSQAALLVAPQTQLVCVATVTLPLPPLEEKDWLVGEME
jgi:hypothetical protein